MPDTRVWMRIAAGVLGALLAACPAAAQRRQPIQIHYVGHASFLLRFPTGTTVLTDYGESRAYGLDSPVYGLGGVRPDVVTRSHAHPDHAGGRLPPNVGTIVSNGERFEANGLRITPIATFEAKLEASDNSSFLIEYDGVKILHLGDCQALIKHAAEPAVAERIRALYPDTYDLVLLPIGYIDDILADAARFVTLLDARRVVPMHYWRPADRDAFLELLRGRTDARGRPYRVRTSPGPTLILAPDERDAPVDSVAVVGLTPAEVPDRGGDQP